MALFGVSMSCMFLLRPFFACHVFTSWVFSTTFSSIHCVHCVHCVYSIYRVHCVYYHTHTGVGNAFSSIHCVYWVHCIYCVHCVRCVRCIHCVHCVCCLHCVCHPPHTGVGNTFSSVNTRSSRSSELVEHTAVNSQWQTQRCKHATSVTGLIHSHTWLITTDLTRITCCGFDAWSELWRQHFQPLQVQHKRSVICTFKTFRQSSSHISQSWFKLLVYASDAKKDSNFLFSASLLVTGIQRQGFSCHLSHNMASVYIELGLPLHWRPNHRTRSFTHVRITIRCQERFQLSILSFPTGHWNSEARLLLPPVSQYGKCVHCTTPVIALKTTSQSTLTH